MIAVPGTRKVRTANATAVSAQNRTRAALDRLADKLRAAGYRVTPPRDAAINSSYASREVAELNPDPRETRMMIEYLCGYDPVAAIGAVRAIRTHYRPTEQE